MDIPNLFTANDEAERLYLLMLVRLSMYDAFEEVIDAVNQIRQHAIATVGELASLFTMSLERDAYWYLGRHTENWERHKQCETLLFGDLLDLTSADAEERDVYFAAEYRAPLHYACGRYLEGAMCKELELSLVIGRASSTDFFYSVTNDDEGEPTHPVRVTLRHVYEKLGRSLSQWGHWSSFVNDLPGTLLKTADTTTEQLQANPGKLAVVDAALTEQRGQSETKRPSSFRRSPWESELLKHFPFIEAYPHPRSWS